MSDKDKDVSAHLPSRARLAAMDLLAWAIWRRFDGGNWVVLAREFELSELHIRWACEHARQWNFLPDVPPAGQLRCASDCGQWVNWFFSCTLKDTP